MNPNDQTVEKQKLEIKKREEATMAEMKAILDEIVMKPFGALTVEDKQFLQARRDYLSRAQLEEFKDVLAEDLNKEKREREEAEARSNAGDSNVDPLALLTRAQLEEKATGMGFQDVSKRAFKTNKDLIDAINAA